MPESASVRLQLLGRFAAWHAGALLGITSRKGRALLAFLALRPDLRAGRDEIATLLWGDRSDRQARQNLRQCLVQLRRDLGAAADCLQADAEAVYLQNVDSDCATFLQLSRRNEAESVAAAVALYEGELLAGFPQQTESFEEWLATQRMHINATAEKIFARHVENLAAPGQAAAPDGEEVCAVAERLLAFDPLREDRHRLLVRLYACHIGPEAALSRARSLTLMLKNELGISPEPATVALLDELRRQIGTASQAITTPSLGLERPAIQTNSPQLAARPAAAVESTAAPFGLVLEQAQAPAAPPLAPEAIADPREGAECSAQPEAAGSLPGEGQVAPQPPATSTHAETADDAVIHNVQPRRDVARASMVGTIAFVTLALIGVAGTYLFERTETVRALGTSAAVAAKPPMNSWQSPPPPSGAASVPSTGSPRDLIPIIVLPFQTYGEGGETEMLAEMLTDDLTNTLSRLQALRVISRQTSRFYRDRPHDAAELGRELGVRYVLEGSMRRVGEKLRVNVEMIDAATRLSVWTERIERSGADQQSVQDEIVTRVAHELQQEMVSVESRRRAKDNDSEALTYRGWATMQAAYARSTLAEFERAKGFFLQALEKDPENTRARIGVAAVHANIGAQVLSPNPVDDLDTAIAMLQQVLEQNPKLWSAYHFLGLAYGGKGEGLRALAAFERAVEHNPSAAGSHAHIGNSLLRFGRPAEALSHIQYAMRLSPRDPNIAYWNDFAGIAYLDMHDYPKAIDSFTRATTLNPDYPRAWAGLIAAHALAGNIDGATKYAERLRKLVPDLDANALVQRFGRHRDSQLRQGLRLIFVAH